MYEDNKTSVVRRIVWLAISVLVIAGLVWLLLWLFVWRGSNTTSGNKGATQKVTTSQSTGVNSAPSTTAAPSTNSTTQPPANDSTAPAPTATSTGLTSSTSTTQPALANTGPGSFVAPIAVAVAGGTIYYNVRLRRKLQR